MSVLPSVWTMEIDLYHERFEERELQMMQVASSNSSLVNTDEDKVCCVKLSYSYVVKEKLLAS
jgi:aspartate/glutamate racemase